MNTMGQTPEQKKVMDKSKDMNEMYNSGGREIFKAREEVFSFQTCYISPGALNSGN